MNRKTLFSILLTIFTLSIFSPVVIAVSDNANTDRPAKPDNQDRFEARQLDLAQKKADRETDRAARKAEVCANIGERIDAKVARFEENKGQHLVRFGKLIDKLNRVITKLGEKDFDVSKLEEDLATLQTMIDEYAVSYSAFISTLDFTRGFACGDSDGDFRDALAITKADHSNLKLLRAEIREFYRTVIRVDIQDLRDQASEVDETEKVEDEE